MNMSIAADLRNMTMDALRDHAETLRRDIAGRTFSKFQQKEKNVRALRFLRKDLARALTVLSEREKTPKSSSSPQHA